MADKILNTPSNYKYVSMPKVKRPQDGGDADMSFHQAWLNNRKSQMFENKFGQSVDSFQDKEDEEFVTKQDMVNNEINAQIDRAKKYKEYTSINSIPEEVQYSTWAAYNEKFPDDKAQDYKSVFYGFPRNGTLAQTDPSNKAIVYYNATGRLQNIHERTHALESSSPLPQHYKIAKIQDNAGIKRNSYLEQPKEVYARLMQFRHDASLQPNKKYTIDDIKNLRKEFGKQEVNGEQLLNRYSDDVLLQFLNDVAQNKSNNNLDVAYARQGSKLIPKKRYGKFNR